MIAVDRARRPASRSAPRSTPTAEDVDRAVAAARAAFPALARHAGAGAREGDPHGAPRSCASTPTSSRGSKRSTPAIRSRRCASTSRSAPATWTISPGLVTEIKGDTIPIGAGTLNYTLREPLGVVARIGAFNHPLLFTAGKCGAPLVAGNTLIVKPADQTPLSSLRIAELWDDVFPPGVFNVVTGGRDAGAALVAHPKVAKIGFIGSVNAGRAVMSARRRDAEGAHARARRQERADRLRRRRRPPRSPTASCAA